MKLKSFLYSQRTFLAGLLVLVGVVSYQLGRSSVAVSSQEQATAQAAAGIIFSDAPALVIPADAIEVMASRGGTKYHRLDCPGAQTINQENMIYFDSLQLAEAAGYTPAANCDW